MSELGGTLGDQAESVLINIKRPGLYPWGKRQRPRGAADIDKESKQDLHYRYLPRCRSPTWPSGNCSLCRRCFPGDLVCSAPEVLQIPGRIGIGPSRPGVSVNSPRRGGRPASGLSGSARGVRLGGLGDPSPLIFGRCFQAVEGGQAGAMQSESGIVADFEVGEEFHEEPKTYYELKSQPLKSR